MCFAILFNIAHPIKIETGEIGHFGEDGRLLADPCRAKGSAPSTNAEDRSVLRFLLLTTSQTSSGIHFIFQISALPFNPD
jgi:hypothetical protein